MRIGQKLSFPLIVLAVSNIVTGLSRNEGIHYYLSTVGIFLVFVIILNLIKKDIHFKIVSIALLLFSIYSQKEGEVTELTGVCLFIFSIIISSKNKKSYIIYSILFAAVTMYKFNINNMIPSQMGAYLSGASFIIIIYQHYIHSKINKQDSPDITLESYYSPEVNNDVVDIIQNRCMGFDWPEINVKLELCIKDSEVPRKVRNEKNRLGFKTQDQFNLWLFEMGIIKPKTDKINM